MALLEGAFSWKGIWGDSWAIMPIMVARAIPEKTGARICELESGPPDEIIYYIVGPRRKPELVQSFIKRRMDFIFHHFAIGHRKNGKIRVKSMMKYVTIC